ncbi:MAG: hypothetical protein H0V24_10215, partial [Chloroflexia bacterium]|nr:hypothetical protein [Chloroflexia bacterium]
MDGSRFDQLTRTFVATISRRRLVSALAAGAAGVVGREEEAAAAGKKVGTTCGNGKKCCKGATCKNTTCRCRAGRRDCGDGRCEKCCASRDCPDGQTCCQQDNQCVALLTDPGRCGRCQNSRCPGATDFCINGECATAGCT